jgi:hypothetical protein
MKHRHDGALGVLCRFSCPFPYSVLRSGVAVETFTADGSAGGSR